MLPPVAFQLRRSGCKFADESEQPGKAPAAADRNDLSRAKYCDMNVLDAQKVEALDEENRRLKKLLAESMLDVSALKDFPEKGGSGRQRVGRLCFV